MSTDLERRLRDTLERRQAEITGPLPERDVPRRARRRQARVVILASLLSALLVMGIATAFVVVGDGAARDERPRPAADDGTLPTPGPAPHETSLVIGTGTQGETAW